MARTSNFITQAEVDNFINFCAKHNLYTDERNGALGDYVVLTLDADITEASLRTALTRLRDQLAFKSPAQIEFEQLIERMTDQQKEMILSFICRRRMVNEGDKRLENFNILASWFVEKNQPVVADMLDFALTNIVNSGRRQLHWLPRLQDSELERKRAIDAARAQPPRHDRTNWSGDGRPETTLAPHLAYHRDMLHRAPDKSEFAKQSNPDLVWKQRAEVAVASIQSNVDRAQAEGLLKKAGGWGWELTFKHIEKFIEHRKVQRESAGR